MPRPHVLIMSFAALLTVLTGIWQATGSDTPPKAERQVLCYSGDLVGHPTGEICVPLPVPLPV